MANANSFPLVRGRTMRVTKTDGCCGPEYGNDNSIVTEGFVSVALTANITEAEEITVTNANGKTCVRDTGSATFDGYGVEIVFCEVQPCLFSLITGQPVVTDAAGDIIGFKMNSQITLDSSGFALEVWMGVPGVACEGDAGANGYLLLPCLQGGVIGDFTIENAAITFTITGAATKDGNAWGNGPYPDTLLPDPLDPDDHLYVIFTTSDPPEATDGCVPLTPEGLTVEVSGAAVTVTIPRAGADPCFQTGQYVGVAWGDGDESNDPDSGTELTHTYALDGDYTLQVIPAPGPDGACIPYDFDVSIVGAAGVQAAAKPVKKAAAAASGATPPAE